MYTIFFPDPDPSANVGRADSESDDMAEDIIDPPDDIIEPPADIAECVLDTMAELLMSELLVAGAADELDVDGVVEPAAVPDELPQAASVMAAAAAAAVTTTLVLAFTGGFSFGWERSGELPGRV